MIKTTDLCSLFSLSVHVNCGPLYLGGDGQTAARPDVADPRLSLQLTLWVPVGDSR